RAASPPPWRTAATRAVRSSSAVRMTPALASNAGDRGSTVLLRTGMGGFPASPRAILPMGRPSPCKSASRGASEKGEPENGPLARTGFAEGFERLQEIFGQCGIADQEIGAAIGDAVPRRRQRVIPLGDSEVAAAQRDQGEQVHLLL